MSIEFSRKEEINNRLKELVEEVSRGNASEFAKLTGIKVQTFHSYLKGQIPKTEAVIRICVKLNLNANWFLRGVEPKYLNTFDESKEISEVKEGFCSLIEEWMTETAEEDPRKKDWFELQFEKKFPEFKEWLGTKDILSRKVYEGFS